MSTGGNIWTTLFGRSVVTWLWGTLVTRLHVVVSLVVQVAVVIGVAVAVHRFALLDEKKSMWLACGLIAAVLAAECAFHARSPIDATVMKAAQEPDERCKPTTNGTYPVLSLPQEKHRSSVRSPVNPVCEQRRGCEKCCVLRALICLFVCLFVCLSSVNANNPPADKRNRVFCFHVCRSLHSTSYARTIFYLHATFTTPPHSRLQINYCRARYWVCSMKTSYMSHQYVSIRLLMSNAHDRIAIIAE
jgi:hypothetical protein